MGRRTFRGEITIAYEPDEGGWTRASLPAVPEVHTAGRTQADAREKVVDALVELLSLEPNTPPGLNTERLRIDLSLGRSIDEDLTRER